MCKALALVALCGSVVHADPAMQPSAAPVAPAESCLCRWPVNGAAKGEPLEERIERLEVALRLSKAERKVNRRGVK